MQPEEKKIHQAECYFARKQQLTQSNPDGHIINIHTHTHTFTYSLINSHFFMQCWHGINEDSD